MLDVILPLDTSCAHCPVILTSQILFSKSFYLMHDGLQDIIKNILCYYEAMALSEVLLNLRINKCLILLDRTDCLHTSINEFSIYWWICTFCIHLLDMYIVQICAFSYFQWTTRYHVYLEFINSTDLYHIIYAHNANII